MSTRKDKLERLRVASPCESSWEAMEGDPRRRRCLECDKPVYDFARLSAREIAGMIEASQGHLCARLTRDGFGRLLTLEPEVAQAEPREPRRVSPLVAAAVAAVLGLGGTLAGTGWTDPVGAVSPAGEPGAGKPAGGARPQRAGDTGGTLAGRLTNEAGEPVPDAEVKLYSQLDHQDRTGRTDADGRFSFTALLPGIYGVQTTVRGHLAAHQWDVLLAAGERRQVGLTVPPDAWERIVAGAPVGVALGGVIAMPREPLRQVFDGASLVVLGVAGKSAVVGRQEYTQEIRTDVRISAVVKGETRERVISIFHEQQPDEDPASRLAPGAPVLAFLEPREAADGRFDGYAASDPLVGLRELPEDEVEAYRERLEVLARIPREGWARAEEVVEWLVATAEDPVTRGEAAEELSDAAVRLAQKAEHQGAPEERYAGDLRRVLADFLAAGGNLDVDADPALLAAFLTQAHQDRLTTALLRTPGLTDDDLDLYSLVSRWHEDRLYSWLMDKLKTADLTGDVGRRLRGLVVQEAGSAASQALLAQGEQRIGEIESQLYDASDEATRQDLEAKLRAAEEELRRQLVEALGRR